MDQLSAHLDRGWDLVQKGDLKGARASARRALETNRDSPEAHNLLGHVAVQEGDADEALEHYRQAMALDDGYIDPILSAAEVLIHPLHEWDEAIALCDEVLEFAEGKEEQADALLLKFDALIGKGEREAATAVLALLPDEPLEGPMYPFLIGRALWEVGDTERALTNLREAVKVDPENPDAHFYLALALEQKKDLRGATLAFLEARELDLQLPRPSWAPTREVFQQTVEKALGQLEPDVAKHLNDILVLVADAPGMEIIADGVDPRVPLVLDGMPGEEEGAPIAERMFIYQRNLERMCGGLEQLEGEISTQVSEEVRHALEHRHSHEGDEARRETKGATRGVPPEGGRGRDAARERSEKPAVETDEKHPVPDKRRE